MLSRRRLMRTALHASLKVLAIQAGLLPLLSRPARAELLGRIPKDMPFDRSIYRLSGNVWVNGKAATLTTFISANSTVETGPASEIIFVVGKDAHILRENSKLTLNGTGVIETGLNVITGKLLSVFGKRETRESISVSTSTSTIGIRGTGLYTESYPDFSYVCTCYGKTDIVTSDGSERKQITAIHHDAPQYIYAKPIDGGRFKSAPLINHTDQELAIIEALVGRALPFANFLDSYQSPQRPY